ncbi:hypothetical protein BDAP_001785 [Binucleata daphniae]
MVQKNKDLIEIQAKLNQNFSKYVKTEFLFHLQNHLEISQLLDERNEITSKINDFWKVVLKNSDIGYDNKTIDYGFVEKLVVNYEDNFWCSVDIYLRENTYTKNTKLYKRFNVMTEEVEYLPIEWKNKKNDVLLHFFNSEEVDFDMFDTLYDTYVNAIDYYYNDKI